MKQQVIIATKNSGKAKEFESLFSAFNIKVKTLLDFPDAIDVEETGHTFEENAVLKAETIASQFGQMVLADDSGLCIDALNGRPGIYSARYAGEEKDDEKNIDKVLKEMKDVPAGDRSARFYCALALAVPGEKTITVSGTCEGEILRGRHGENGFGYDPIFFLKEKGVTMAEIPSSEKNQISHRAAALQNLYIILKDKLNQGEMK
ncbi:XTP/dITP diphosphatase [Heyndrickxia oleronia]|uniref:XTP/dITP diphosphatase n=1 Tax=Heyndrickxia oleronia TaxID=38875 RepID=UPI0020416108|nr:XTP/dITP diphosphatase [Heyndrickxia oleronia]MCM3237184.1 XTP/dITP diphosphatase [Heyndrickxia oleronia]